VKPEVWTPQRAATRLVRIAETFSNAHGLRRFPVDVRQLALGAADIFGWKDPITQVQAASIKKFEGALFPGEDRSKWLLLYNQTLTSPGRIRFTMAHELGHYILHRLQRDSFECSSADMLNWSQDEKDMEGQADLFASYLLMPLDDYRAQVGATVDLDVLGQCAERYGVSLTAAILKWLSYTDEKAVLVMSNNGFIDWAWSSEPALKAGAFFKTRTSTVELPSGSLAADAELRHERAGTMIPASVWFRFAESQVQLREMKVRADQYDSVLTLLCLPRAADFWPPYRAED
jgi:hypothetical protein